MASRDSLEMRTLASTGTIVQASGQDSVVALVIKYKGTGTVTSVVVTTATDITLTSSEGAAAFTFAAYTTLGAVVDAIHASANWDARIVGALRSAASASRLLAATVTATTDETGASVYEIKLDTSTGLQYAVCLSPRASSEAPYNTHRVKLQQIDYAINMATAAVDSVQIWKRSIEKGIETKISGVLSVDTTATTIQFASGEGSVDGKDGEEIIVLVKDAATLADATTNILTVVGRIE